MSEHPNGAEHRLHRFNSAELKAIAKVLVDALTHSDIDDLMQAHGVAVRPRSWGKRDRIYDGLWGRQREDGDGEGVAAIVEEAMHLARCSEEPSQFDQLRHSLNEVLSLSQLVLDDGGKLAVLGSDQDPTAPEPSLATAMYEQILQIMTNMGSSMERLRPTFARADEETLRDHFLVQLNGRYAGQATGETFNASGKTDILIRAQDRNVFIAECKFWDGPRSLVDAIDQLLSYTCWRDTKTAVLLFNRGTAFSTVLEKIPGTLQQHPNFVRGADFASETGFRCVLHHRDDARRELILTVLAFEVPAG